MNAKKLPQISAFALHIMAMVFMLCEHIQATVSPQATWLAWFGRLAMPIFAFLLVEGYFHTKNLKLYLLRMFLFALISEIPFNLAMAGSVRFPFQQNILWAYFASLLLIFWNERAKASGSIANRIVVGISSVFSACIIGVLTFVDYFPYGLLTVLVFYFFRGHKWWCYAGQALCLGYISIVWMGRFGYLFPWVTLLALIPLWLYRGKQGYHNKVFQYACYAFFPVHLLILGFLKMIP